MSEWRELAAGLPVHEAERLLLAVTGGSRADLLRGLSPRAEQFRRYEELVRRRVAGEPLQYLEGTVDFGPLTLRIDHRALIPRPETEEMWAAVVSMTQQQPPAVIVDVGTGSGNLALALKAVFPDASVYGTDIDPDALSLAGENSRLTGLDVNWLEGDLFDALPGQLRGRVDLMVSNPPYVATADAYLLPVDVRDHEPPPALFAGEDGSAVLARIAREARRWLSPGGLLVCELSPEQADHVVRLLDGFDSSIGYDANKRARWVAGRVQ